MGGKKKLLKGLKYISQFFGYKEHELEIGYPTDVRHVAHVGWDGPVNASSWMNENKTADFSSNALSSSGQSRETSWISQDFDQPRGLDLHSEIPVDGPCPDIPKAPKKTRQKKSKLKSPSSSSRTSKSQGFICRG